MTQERVHPVAVSRPAAPTAVRDVTSAVLFGSTVAAAAYASLLLAGAPFAEPAAVLAGLCAVLPRVGVVLAGIVCVSLIDPPLWEVGAAACVGTAALVHRRVLGPRLFALAGSLSPAVVAASVLVAAAFAGLPGAVLALPVVAAVKAAVLRRSD